MPEGTFHLIKDGEGPSSLPTSSSGQYGSTKSSDYVAGIDALRCFAMSAVIILHAGLLPFGWLGVWLFFVISGFAITRSLMADVASEMSSATIIGHFYLKRTLRILPLYLFYLLLVSLYAHILRLDHFWPALPFLLSLTYNLAIALGSPVEQAPGVVQLWSISGEEQFYLVFPFLFVFLRRPAFITVMAIVIIACPIARGLLSTAIGGTPWDAVAAARGVIFFTPVHFDAFAAGSVIALLTSGRTVSRRAGYASLAIGFGALGAYVAACAALQTARLGHFGPASLHNILSANMAGDHREVFGFTAIWLLSAGLILAVLARVPLVERMCRPRIFRAIGRVSYGGYVYHGLCVEVLTRAFPGINSGTVAHKLVFLVLLYALAMALAFASYRWIERPFLKLKPARQSLRRDLGPMASLST